MDEKKALRQEPVRIAIRISDDLHKRIKYQTERIGGSQNTVMAMLIDLGLKIYESEGGFMARKKTEYTCTVTFTEGGQERLTQGFVDLYYSRMKRGEPVTEEQAQEQKKEKIWLLKEDTG